MRKVSDVTAAVIAKEVVDSIGLVLEPLEMEYNQSLTAEQLVAIVQENFDMTDEELIEVESFLSSELFARFNKCSEATVNAITGALLGEEDV